MLKLIGVAAIVTGVVTFIDYARDRNNMKDTYKNIGKSISDVANKTVSITKGVINKTSDKIKSKQKDTIVNDVKDNPESDT